VALNSIFVFALYFLADVVFKCWEVFDNADICCFLTGQIQERDGEQQF